jgi:hypothetical protein
MGNDGVWFGGELGGVDDVWLDVGVAKGGGEADVITGEGGGGFWVEVGGVDGAIFKSGVSGVVGGGGGMRDCKGAE